VRSMSNSLAKTFVLIAAVLTAALVVVVYTPEYLRFSDSVSALCSDFPGQNLAIV
jgi:hypothetical protein